MSTNPNEFVVLIEVQRNDIGFNPAVERKVVVEGGTVDINSIVEDMIDTLKK